LTEKKILVLFIGDAWKWI